MDRGARPAQRGEEERLLAALERLLRRAMGISMPAYGSLRLSPLPFAAIWSGAYVVAAAAVIGLAEYTGRRGDPRFVGLIVWGLAYFTAVLFFTRLATVRALDIVRRDILPYATPAFIAAVADDLERRDTAANRWTVPLIAAFLTMAASTGALGFEEPRIDVHRFAPIGCSGLWSPSISASPPPAAASSAGSTSPSPAAGAGPERFYVLGAAAPRRPAAA